MANTIVTGQNVSGASAVDAAKQAAAQSSAKAAAQSVTSQRADQANVSNFGALVAQASASSDVRSDRVASLSAAISSGTYHVPASAVASKIVDSLLS